MAVNEVPGLFDTKQNFRNDRSGTSHVLDAILAFTKARLHQRRSNLRSTEPSSSLIGDLNRVQVTFRCTNLNSDQLIVVQLNGGGYSVGDADWLTTVTSRKIFTC